MRDFNEADKERKQERIQVEANPGELSPEKLAGLEKTVKASLKDGYLPCPVAWKIAKQAGVPRIAVGGVTDRLGIRVTECQLGCFKVEKTPYDGSVPKSMNDEVVARLEALKAKGELTCANMFELAHSLKLAPMAVADVANARGLKTHSCQLGCF